MGGSGGGGGGFISGETSPREFRKMVAAAQGAARDEVFEAEVSGVMNSILASANGRDAQALERHMNTIKQALSTDIEGEVRLLFGGSIAKHTYVDGLSDADALVILNKSELRDESPASVRAHFVQRLRERLPETKITEGNLAVSVAFNDIVIQLVPALRRGPAVCIPDSDGRGWSSTIRPDGFATKLTTVNQALNGKVVPTIKLAKVVISQLPEQQRLTGYHVESLAIQAFKQYGGPITPKSMLQHFFSQAASDVKRPVRDSTGQSVHVDEYLGAGHSLPRRIISDSLARVGRMMANADGAKSIEQWKSILGEVPSADGT